MGVQPEDLSQRRKAAKARKEIEGVRACFSLRLSPALREEAVDFFTASSRLIREVVMSESLAISAKRLAANRRNARSSTGPRTRAGKSRSAMNRFKHGLFSESLGASLRAVGEDPAEFERLLEGLREEWKPRTTTSERLVRQLGGLIWKLDRLERAERGVVARRLEGLEIARSRKMLGVARHQCDASEFFLETLGLRGLPNSAAKFEEILAILNQALEMVRKREFTFDFTRPLGRIYGQRPTARSQEIASRLTAYSMGSAEFRPEDEEEEARATELPLLEEIEQVQEEYDLYKREHLEVSQALR